MAHIGVGVASALVLVHPTSVEDCVAVAIGAAAGSIICDVDIRSGRMQRDAFRGRMAVLVLISGFIVYDALHGGAFLTTVVSRFGTQAVSGITAFVATCVLGALMPHRTFAHSLVGMGCWCWSLSLVLPQLLRPFAVGVSSHLLLDLTNHKGLQLFWPLSPKMCLGLWRSSGLVNALLSVAAPAVALLLFSLRMMQLGA